MFPVTSVTSKLRGRWTDQRGAVLVEAALAIPLLLLIILGSIEFGFAWDARSAATAGVRTGVLRAASIGDEPQTDMRIIQSIIGEIGVDEVSDIEYILVFNATGESDKAAVISDCAAGVSAAECVKYDTSVLLQIATSSDPATYQADNFDPGGNEIVDADDEVTGYTCETGLLDSSWCAPSRTAIEDVEVGVAVRYQHDWVTGIFPFDPPVFNEFATSSTFIKGGTAITPNGGPIGGTVVYQSNFQLPPGKDPTPPFGFTDGLVREAPNGSTLVLGPFGLNEPSTTLELVDLPSVHDEICASFKLHIIGDWENTGINKDTFSLTLDGDVLFDSNSMPGGGFRGGSPPPEASAINGLGSKDGGFSDNPGHSWDDGDFTIDVPLTCVPLTSTTADISFLSSMSSNVTNEAWAISDIEIVTR